MCVRSQAAGPATAAASPDAIVRGSATADGANAENVTAATAMETGRTKTRCRGASRSLVIPAAPAVTRTAGGPTIARQPSAENARGSVQAPTAASSAKTTRLTP